MIKDKKKVPILEVMGNVVPFLGPILFEIANLLSGDWINENQKFNFSAGKVITIIIGLVYIGMMIYIVICNEKKKESVENFKEEIEALSQKVNAYEKSNEMICTLLDYLKEKINGQIDYFKEHKRIDVRDININSAAANICKIIYQNIIENKGNGVKVTVNMYNRYKENGIEYTNMIAHEGHISQPTAFGTPRILYSNKTPGRFSDKALKDNSPDYRIYLTTNSVAKAFGISNVKCKYSQYLGIPIRKKGGNNIALIEIVLHDGCTIWKDKDEATQFAADYCEILKGYILLIDKLNEQGIAIANKIDEGIV